jgi:hypothetical protein
MPFSWKTIFSIAFNTAASIAFNTAASIAKPISHNLTSLKTDMLGIDNYEGFMKPNTALNIPQL